MCVLAEANDDYSSDQAMGAKLVTIVHHIVFLSDLSVFIFLLHETQTEHLEGNSLSDYSLSDLEMLKMTLAQNMNNLTLRSIVNNKKLIGPNFTNWHRNLRIALRYEKKLVHLEQPLQPAPDSKTATLEAVNAYYELVNAEQEVVCLMLAKEQAKHKLFERVKALHAYKQEDGQSVSFYLLKMKGYLDTLECLGYPMPQELGVSLILNSLSKDYEQFVQNYNMHSMGKTIAELHAMLKLTEKGLPKKAATPVVLAIRGGYALEATVHILNMVPTKKVDNAPYEIWHGKAPNLSYLMVWGYEALMKRDTHNRLESRSVKYIFIGYPKETMGYYFSNPHKNKIFVVHYVEFFESSLTSQEASGSNVDLEIIQEENTQPSE
ncbi:hypothetical protein Tco_0487226, partial [Tanacetum coccineum]